MEGKRFKTTWKHNDMVDFHLKAIGRELQQLKTAFKLAVALNRTIIMPKVGDGRRRAPERAVEGRFARCCVLRGAEVHVCSAWVHVALPGLTHLAAACFPAALTHTHTLAHAHQHLHPPTWQLLAWCDRYWGPLEYCQVPGAFRTRLPFVAPMDHIIGGRPAGRGPVVPSGWRGVDHTTRGQYLRVGGCVGGMVGAVQAHNLGRSHGQTAAGIFPQGACLPSSPLLRPCRARQLWDAPQGRPAERACHPLPRIFVPHERTHTQEPEGKAGI